MKFWRKKHKKSKSEADAKNTSTDSNETEVKTDADEESSATSTSDQDSAKAETVNGETNEITEPQGEIGDDVAIESESESEPDDTTETSITETASSVEETNLSETEEEVSDKYYEDAQSGVFIFGKKIDGRFEKVLFAVLAITLIPPTFLFSIALLVCITLLIFPLITIIIIAAFPATIFSFFILMAVLPVLFPAILIFLLITGKGRLSAFAEGKLLILRVFRWTLPTI